MPRHGWQRSSSVGMKGARIGKAAVKAMPTWTILKRAAKRFPEDDLPDRAAALTYFAVLALFPALIVMVARAWSGATYSRGKLPTRPYERR